MKLLLVNVLLYLAQSVIYLIAYFSGSKEAFLNFVAKWFYASSDVFMAANWPAIAVADFACKILIGACLFLPLYGVLLQFLMRKLTQLAPVQSRVGSH